MAMTEPIRVSCTDCGARRDCEDCLVAFVLGGETAAVATTADLHFMQSRRLDTDLAAVLELLRQSDLDPVVVSLQPVATADRVVTQERPAPGKRYLRDAG